MHTHASIQHVKKSLSLPLKIHHDRKILRMENVKNIPLEMRSCSESMRLGAKMLVAIGHQAHKEIVTASKFHPRSAATNLVQNARYGRASKNVQINLFNKTMCTRVIKRKTIQTCNRERNTRGSRCRNCIKITRTQKKTQQPRSPRCERHPTPTNPSIPE